MRYFHFNIFCTFLFAVTSIFFISCASQDDKLLAPGISIELANERKNDLSDVKYDLFFDIPEDKNDSIHAEIVVEFETRENSQDLILDFNAPPELIKKVEIENQEVDYLMKNEHLIVDGKLISDENRVKITFIAGNQSLNRHDDYLYTLFVPERASTCFPVFDQPNIKAKYKLRLSIPESWKAVANGELKSKENSRGKVIYDFKETLPISSYLFAFAVGNFEVESFEQDGRKMNLYHRETDSLKVENNIKDIFEWHVKSLKWLEEYTSIVYPFPKFDFVLLPSFQYGGMEHPGAIFYKSSSLFLDKSSTLNQQIGRGRLIAHETAHMWFGNLVTMEWFNDVWLKEVFANFMAAKIVNPEFSEIDHDLQFLFGHYPRAYAVDRTEGTHPIQQKLDNLKDAGSLYGAIIYQKAPIVMRMLEEKMGTDSFKAGIREYLSTHAFNNATWDDLIAIMTKHTDNELDRWNQQWVKSAGMPSVFYNIRGDNTIDRFNLFTISNDQERELWWPQDLNVIVGSEDSTVTVKAPLNDRTLNLDLQGMSFPSYVFTNASGLGYGHFRMRNESTDYFLNNINAFESSILRGALWVNLYESTIHGRVRADRLLKTAVSSLTKETEPLILSYINQVIASLFWNFSTHEERVEIAPQLEGILLNMMINSESTNLKATFFNSLLSITISGSGTALLKSIWESEMNVEGLTLSENDYTRLSYELAVREVDGYQDILQTQLDKMKNPDRKKRFEFVIPALSHEKDTRDDFFNSLQSPENRENEEWVLEALRYLHHPLRTSESYEYIRPSLEMLEEIKQTGDIFFPKRWLDNTLSAYRSEEAENEVRQFLYRNNKYPEDLKNKILQSADILFKATEIDKEVKQ